MPRNLILDSLEIQRFRCFRELRIEHLGRVNLIVGKNNVGKSTILDALRLFATPGSSADLLEIFSDRDEFMAGEVEDWASGPIPVRLVESLFFGRNPSTGEEGAIRIGPLDSFNNTLRILLQTNFSSSLLKNQPIGTYKDPNLDGTSSASANARLLLFRVGPATRSVSIARATQKGYVAPSQPGNSSPREEDIFSSSISDVLVQYVGPEGLGPDGIVRLWDDVALSSFEADVIDGLRIISPDVERVATKGFGAGAGRGSNRLGAVGTVPFVKRFGSEEPIPLRALGNGANRLFGISLALVHAEGGLLLVDEIENGIHYSVLADLWRLIFEVAARRGIQVFATTQSYDCIRAFERAAGESEEEGVLVRLAQRGDEILVANFDELELETAVDGNIEVR